jgi:hypothetical protein
MVTANKAVCYDEGDIIENYPNLVIKSIELLQSIIKQKTYVVLDAGGEIFLEYQGYLNFSGQPGVGDVFFKWLHTKRWEFPPSELIDITKTENGYEEFPYEMEHINVDPSDKKYFAVSNAHPTKPDIVEAADSKWWSWRDAALICGINIHFLDEQYMCDLNMEA